MCASLVWNLFTACDQSYDDSHSHTLKPFLPPRESKQIYLEEKKHTFILFMLKPILAVLVLLFTAILSLLLPILSYAQTAATTTIPSSSSSSTAESFWNNGASMPTPRTEIAAALVGDNTYVIGGFDKSGGVTDIVEVYNLKNNSWTKVAPIPQPLHHTFAASYNGKIYVVGGYTDSWTQSNKLFIYDPIQNKWQEGKSMPSARGALNTNFINETLYAVGGSSDKPLPTNEAYDPSANNVFTCTFCLLTMSSTNCVS
jgi:hypothetical protein